LTLKILTKADADKVLSDVKNAVDQIQSFPADAEAPTSRIIQSRAEAIALVLYGDVSEQVLRYHSEKVRSDLLDFPEITMVEFSGTKPREISIEVSKRNLRAHNINLSEIANQIRLSSIDVPAGELRTPYESLSLRARNRKYSIVEYEAIENASDLTGARILLGDIAKINDGFEDVNVVTRFNGKPAIMIRVFRTGSHTPTRISKIVKTYMAELKDNLPEAIGVQTWNDMAELYTQRVNLVLRNAFLGLILVFFVLGLFLEARLAFWVTMGIPASFLGSFLLLPTMDVSINMISLFAFIVTLGMVVDDAIIVGENIYSYRGNSENDMSAAVIGTKKMAIPVSFAILTTVAAFMPMFFVPGIFGKFFRVIPAIVVSVLVISLLESLFILPAHLAKTHSTTARTGIRGWLHHNQQAFSRMFMQSITTYYKPLVEKAVRLRYLTVAVSISILVVTISLYASGRMGFTFMPNIDSDIVTVSAQYPIGTPIEKTERLQRLLAKKAHEVLAKIGGIDKARGIFSQIGKRLMQPGPVQVGTGFTGGHSLEIMTLLVSSNLRSFSGEEFAAKWREAVGTIPGLKTIGFSATMGPAAGADIEIRVAHRDVDTLETAALDLAEQLKNYPGLAAIRDGVSETKKQIEFKIKPAARRIGLTAHTLGLQVRSAFYGAEAIREQRGRDEVKVVVRLPKNERASLFAIENFLVHTKMGDVPLGQIAEVTYGSAYSTIEREDGRQVVRVKADYALGSKSHSQILSEITSKLLPNLDAKYPGLVSGFSGQQREQNESMRSLGLGYLIALLVIYALLAIPFRSYVQPIIVMSVIPFGFVGATIGHIFLGYDLSFISIMGIVALSGVVVNDSLVLIHAINQSYRESGDLFGSVVKGGVRRFRPIILTSLTTFFGLIPMIFEPSLQARFLIPMAISLGFGVMFATFITLLLVPSIYVIIEDAKEFAKRMLTINQL